MDCIQYYNMSQAPIEQATAIPYRRQGPWLEFCLITTAQGLRWGFPKGIIEPGQTAEEAALQESVEEAGLHGLIEGDDLGAYDYSKWGRTLHVRAFLMQVSQTDDDWLEAHFRRRAWCSFEEARSRLDRPPLRQLLAAALARLEGRPAR
jgi:8-oxo-dGTP pyrophosphatase MutT (NUDIX family)